MTQKITPCLWFDGEAEAATTFYVSAFRNGELLDIFRYGDGGPGEPGSVLTTRFRLAGLEVMTINAGPQHQPTPAISLSVDCGSQAEVDRFWDALTDGGEPGQCSWLKDRFGVSWQIVPSVMGDLLGDPDPEKAARAMQAMMSMTKIDIAAMRRAHAGEAA